jgi:hypothetical protein
LLILLLFVVARIIGGDRTKARRRPKLLARLGELYHHRPDRPAPNAPALAVKDSS